MHNTDDLYFASQSGIPHAQMDCQFVDERVIDNRRWRVATSVECRRLGPGWCVDCCSDW